MQMPPQGSEGDPYSCTFRVLVHFFSEDNPPPQGRECLQTVTEHFSASLGFGKNNQLTKQTKQTKLHSEQNIIQMKFKSGLLIHSYKRLYVYNIYI